MMTTNNYVWEKDLSLNDLVLKQKEEIEKLNKRLEEKFMKENPFLVENGIICQKNKEIERLNNIINELEKYLNEQIQKSWEIEEQCYEDIESKLQELKGVDKE